MEKIIKSRTTWTIVGMFLVGGVNAITEFIPASFLPIVEGGLGILAIYFKQNPSQEY